MEKRNKLQLTSTASIRGGELKKTDAVHQRDTKPTDVRNLRAAADEQTMTKREGNPVSTQAAWHSDTWGLLMHLLARMFVLGCCHILFGHQILFFWFLSCYVLQF